MEKLNLRNLRRGRNYLRDHVTDEQFNMGEFISECGTVGCALGWMSKCQSTPILDEWGKWVAFSINFLGIWHSPCWDFMFSSNYVGHDNTLEGAIGRINVILKYPDLFDEVNGEN